MGPQNIALVFIFIVVSSQTHSKFHFHSDMISLTPWLHVK